MSVRNANTLHSQNLKIQFMGYADVTASLSHKTKSFYFSKYHTNNLFYYPHPCQNEVISKHILLLISGYRCCVLRGISSNQWRWRLELCSGSGKFLRFRKIPVRTCEIGSDIWMQIPVCARYGHGHVPNSITGHDI